MLDYLPEELSIDYLPEELSINILARVPVKTLLQIRCVSKSWHALITSPNFIKAQANNSSSFHLLIVRCYTRWPAKREYYSLHFNDERLGEYRKELECPTPNYGDLFHILGSCNGLLCLTDVLFGYTYNIILWNPTISKLVTLPEPRVTFDSHGPYRLVLGFGYDCQTDDYKVVRLAYLSRSCTVVELYSLKKGSWRSTKSVGPPYPICYNSSSAFVNGALHWVGHYKAKPLALVVLFDMGTEAFHKMKLPKSLAQRPVPEMSVRAFGKSLSIFRYDSESRKESLWVMKEYGVEESWTKLFTFDMAKAFDGIIGLRGNSEVLLAKHVSMVSFDLKTQQVKNLGFHGKADSFYVDTYKESLVLLKEVNELLRDQEESHDQDNCKGGSALLREKNGVGETTEINSNNNR